MKLTITGGAGYVGSTVTAHLLAAGHEVTVLDKLVYGGESLLAFFHHPRFHWMVGDVLDAEVLYRAFTGVEMVVHLAAVVGEQACALDEAEARAINLDGTRVALAAARKAGVQRFLFVSTCSNYGLSAPGEIATEESPLRPLGLYAETKVEAERLALSRGAFVLRFGTICGLSPRMRFDLLVSEMARAAAFGEAVQIFAPEAWRPFLHVRDAARAIEHCLSAPLESLAGRVFNVVGESFQKRQLADLVRRHFPSLAVEVVDRQPDLRDYRVSGERFRRDLGFEALHSIEKALLETCEAVRVGVFRDPFWNGHSAIPWRRRA